MAELEQQGIHNQSVLAAMRTVPRHHFVNPDFANVAYENRSLPIDCEQTVAQPYSVAVMTQRLLEGQLEIKKVLEVGTGCGYQTAVLAELGLRVFTIERIAALQQGAKNVCANWLMTLCIFAALTVAAAGQNSPLMMASLLRLPAIGYLSFCCNSCRWAGA